MPFILIVLSNDIFNVLATYFPKFKISQKLPFHWKETIGWAWCRWSQLKGNEAMPYALRYPLEPCYCGEIDEMSLPYIACKFGWPWESFSTSHISTLHFHHYGANMCCSRAYGQRLLHFLGLQWEWVRCVKQVVKCKVFAQLKMKLCRIRMGEEGRTQDDFYYKFWT